MKITDGIGTLVRDQLMLACEDSNGTSSICDYITQPLPFSDRAPANKPTSIFLGTINSASLRTQGIDFDLQYSTSADFIGLPGRFNLRALVGYLSKYEQQLAPNVAPIDHTSYSLPDVVVTKPMPRYRGTFNLTYADPSFTINIQERWIGGTATVLPTLLLAGRCS